MEHLDTKQQVTKKFVIGVGIIIGSLIMGKAVLIPLILMPGSKQVALVMLILYLLTWPIMFVGIWMAGRQGYRLATHKYKEYQRKTVRHVKRGGQKAVDHMKRGSEKAVHHVKKGGQKAAEGTIKVARETKEVATKTVRTIKRPLKKSEMTFREVKLKRVRGL